MRSLRSGLGYLEIDHRDSPGLTPEQVAGIPWAIAVPGGQRFERDHAQCSHCQRTVILEPLRTRDRGYCPKCYHYICDECESIRVKSLVCVPFVKQIDLVQEHVARFLGREDSPDANPRVVLTDLQEVV